MVRAVSTLLAICYLIFMFIMTHLPKRQVPKTLQLTSDKTLHFLAFFFLGVLASLALQVRFGNRGWVAYALATVGLGILYACFDEITQPLVGRHFDLIDILYDVLGLCAGVLVFQMGRPLMHKVTGIEELR